MSCVETAQGFIYVAASAMVINDLVDPPSPKKLACNEATLLAHNLGAKKWCNSFRLHGGGNEYAEAKLVCLFRNLEGN